jgi:hypothetical protein|tara:strand:+ start:1790 stop:2389 length:600 start_codon:yes stop_codon:yes gene_type:complete
MGKKARKEREEKRESFAARRTSQKRTSNLKAIGVLAIIAAIGGYAGYQFVTMEGADMGAPDDAGRLGDEHEHASLLVRIFGDKFDFSLPNYQIKTSWIHFEDQDGDTIHRHSSGVELEYLFNSVNIGLSDRCFIFADGRQFCTNDDYSLKYFINHEPVKDIRKYVIQEDDRILVSYGDENKDEIEEQLKELDSQMINKK